MKKKVTMTVEASSTGFAVYAEGFPAHGYGKTVQEAKDNLRSAIDELLAFFKETGRPEDPALNGGDLEFDYLYDVASIFEHFGMLDASNLAKYIGMNASLLRQYKNGITVIGEKNKKKLEAGLHKLGQELLAVQL